MRHLAFNDEDDEQREPIGIVRCAGVACTRAELVGVEYFAFSVSILHVVACQKSFSAVRLFNNFGLSGASSGGSGFNSEQSHIGATLGNLGGALEAKSGKVWLSCAILETIDAIYRGP